MQTDLIEILSKLKFPEWGPSRNKATPELIEEAEKSLDVKLPDDYKALLLFSDGGSVNGDRSALNYEPAGRLGAHNRSNYFRENIPGMFVIGDDGGGCIYYYDPANKLGKGAFALHYVPMDSLFFKDSVYVAVSLTDLIQKILAGVSFEDMLT